MLYSAYCPMAEIPEKKISSYVIMIVQFLKASK